MNTDNLKAGDPVEVKDLGLAMLRKFAPPDAPPNNHGFVDRIDEDGTVYVAFPIGDDDIDEHSQLAPYPAHLVRKRT